MESCEFQLYEYMLEEVMSEDDLKRMLATLGGTNVLNFRGVRAKIKARRCSGELFTSLGNGFSNLMLILYIASEHGCDPDDLDGLVEGDDGLFALPFKPTVEEWGGLGFTIKEVHEYTDPGHAHFCGMIFSKSGQIIRDPIRFFQKFGWTHSDLFAGPAIMKGLLRAKALSAMYETPNCPLVAAVARHAIDLTEGVAPRVVEDGYHDYSFIDSYNKSEIPEPAPTADTRQLFFEKFGVPPEEQVKIENLARRGDLSLLNTVVERLLSPQQRRDNYWYRVRYVRVY